MAKSLVIVESPAKARTINKYLGPDYTVKASMGHVLDLPKKELGVNIEAGFKPTYITIPGKKDVIKELESAATKADAIYLAADPDREGEAICAHLRELLDRKKKKIYRVLFNEITRDAIREAFKHAGEIDSHLVDAQQARRILDRLVGYQVSPLLWDKVKRGISAGRVQTVALRLIVEREREIRAFEKREYWTITAHLEGKNPPSFDARLAKIKGQDPEIANQETAERHVAAAGAAGFAVQSVTTREKKKYPVPSFITSKLQQESVRKLHFSAKKTMMLAQKLYEGIEVGEDGATGLITYMRTDSTRVAESALAAARDYIQQKFGSNYLPAQAIHYKTKKDAQDAHEAIRPTEVSRTPESLKRFLGPDEFKLYKLIWQRFVASQMNPAIFDQTTIDITAGPDYLFRATGSVERFNGFRAVYEEGQDDKAGEDESDELKHRLPAVNEGERLNLQKITPEQHFTEPPPRYNEATLVKVLEEKGIGRPSTYATILSVIQNREYVEKMQGRFFPTELGMVTSDLLVKNFSEIFDVAYTARMEEELDEVEEGKLKWTDALAGFYKKFKKELRTAEREMADLKGEGIPTEEKCEKCGKPMVIRLGRNGNFLACTGYPDCDGTRDLTPELAKQYGGGAAVPEVPEEVCEKCGKPMAVKRGRFGYFLACTGYPECRNTKKIVMGDGKVTAVQDVLLEEKCPECGSQLVVKHGRYGQFTACSNYPQCKFVKRQTLGIACPEKGCTGEIVVRRTKRGKAFYGCSRYPDCKFVAWDKPVAEPCPSCGSPILLEKTTKKTGPVRYCPHKSCQYEHALA
ncbi:MAG TPA: type I DNA topoisomerase [Terriglobia bacterium]|nr:type I DNA topoisomerase [Terriglobia bacterium]